VFDQFTTGPRAHACEFNLPVEGGAPVARTVKTQMDCLERDDPGRKAGAAQFVASVGETSVRRVVEQEPLTLAICD